MRDVSPGTNPSSLQGGPSSSSLRIALVTETYPPEINGVAMSVARLVEGFLAEGHRVDLVRPRQPGFDQSARGEGRAVPDPAGPRPRLSVHLTPGAGIPGYPGLRMGLPVPGALRSAWRARRPDLVHIATEGPLGWSALRVARSEGIPVVSEFRTNFHAYSAHYGIGLLRPCVLGYLRQFHNRCATTMVPTRGLAADLQVLGFERLRVVARGVDSRRFDPARRSASLRASWGAGPGDLVAISVGRLAPEKNLGLLVEGCRRMTSIRPGMRLVIVGDGPARPRVEAALPGAIFVGRRVGDDLAAHYASADLMVFPSLTETFGNVTLEAMASGLAVIAFDYGAAGSVIRHGVHGWLAPYGDSAGFLDLLDSTVADPDRIRVVGRQARRHAETMSWDSIVQEVLTIHREAMATSRGPCPASGPEPLGWMNSRPAPRQM